MNKKFKDEFSNICISKELEGRIFDMTINKEKKYKKIPKFAYVSLCAVMICTLSLTVVYAKEIKQFLQNWSSSIEFKDGTKETISENSTYKKIPDTAIKTEKIIERIEMSETEIEDMLNFKILGYDKATTKNMYYGTGLNKDKTIGTIEIWYPKFIYENEEKFISISISMLNENADEGYVDAFQTGLDATGGKELNNTYISENLGVKVIIYSNDWSNKRITATFCYDNIMYEMIGMNMSEQDIKNIIENLYL